MIGFRCGCGAAIDCTYPKCAEGIGEKAMKPNDTPAVAEMSSIQPKLWDSADDDTVESLRQQLANNNVELHDRISQLEAENKLLLTMARHIQELEAEQKAFYMDYRTKCDKDMKALEERIATLTRQRDSALRLQKFFEDGISVLTKEEKESFSLLNLCALLPEGVCWGDTLTPHLVREILGAYSRERYKND